MKSAVVSGVLAAAVAANATVNMAYPAGTTKGYFYNATGHVLVVGQSIYTYPKDFDITLNASNVTITNKTAGAWPSGAPYTLQLEELGDERVFSRAAGGVNVPGCSKANLIQCNLGAPAAASSQGVMTNTATPTASAAGTEKLTATVTLDVPRGLSVTSNSAGDTSAWSVLFSGRDQYGRAMSELIAFNGATTVAGKKAFKHVDSAKLIHASGTAMAGTVSFGTTNVLGLPFFLYDADYVLKELTDGAVPTAGTFATGMKTAGGSTTTTADVRGTYAPNQAPDGSKTYVLLWVADTENVGASQA